MAKILSIEIIELDEAVDVYDIEVPHDFSFQCAGAVLHNSQCRTLDQQVFELGKGPRPPLHHNCRSTVLIVLKDEYAGRGNINKRASKDGPVDNESYYSWLNKQPKDFQDDVLGETRGKLLRSGGLSADKFAALQLDKNFKPLTLDEMRSREPMAFKKAGL